MYKTVTKLLSLFLLSSLPMLLIVVCGAGDLAHTASLALLYIVLSFSLLLMALCGAGDLAHTVSVARFCLLLSFSLLLIVVCGAGDLAHTASLALLYIVLSFSLLLMAVCGAGDLAHTVSVVCFCLLLSFSLLLIVVCSAGDLAHTASLALLYIALSFSLLLIAGCGAGDLAHTASLALFLDNTFFSLSFDGHWLVMCANTAVVLLPLGISAINYPPITPLQEDIHSFRNDMLLAIGTFYVLSYRTVGLKIDGNLCPYLLSPTAQQHAPGALARVWLALRALLEPICRQELYKQLATQRGQSVWIVPTATLLATPHPLERATEACFALEKG